MRIGIDIVDIARIETVAVRTPRFVQRVFTRQELEYCYNKSNPYPSLAARFAAKEAVRKLDPIFIAGISFHDVEVVVDEQGRPQVVLHGEAFRKSRQQNLGEISLSLSHTNNQAIAAAIAGKG